MKHLKLVLAVITPLFFASCIVVDNTPGPNGRDGNAYFGVDYEHVAPYSYWDNNNAIPFNPVLGEYYHTNPGIYKFEYFINAYDYYYGTYEVYINRGGLGGVHGELGYDGSDTYLMFIADVDGYHTHGDSFKTSSDDPLVVVETTEKYNYKITIQKGNTNIRDAQQPKFVSK